MNREFSVCICGLACEHFILLFLCFFSLLFFFNTNLVVHVDD